MRCLNEWGGEGYFAHGDVRSRGVCILLRPGAAIQLKLVEADPNGRYRSPVKEWQVSWFVLGTITLNGTDTTVKRLDRNVKTLSADSSAIFANIGSCAIQSYCPQSKLADLPLFYWRPIPYRRRRDARRLYDIRNSVRIKHR